MNISAAAIAVSAAAISASAALKKEAACTRLMDGYTHNGSTLAGQQAYAACVPAPVTDAGHVQAQLFVFALLLALPIGLVVGIVLKRQAYDIGEACLAGGFAATVWALCVLVFALFAAGVVFVFF